jgi:hypothetical protein
MPGVSTATTGLPSHLSGAQAAERAAQVLRIVADRLDADLAREQFREHLQHRLAVLQHVGDAGRRAGIVLQHVELVLAGAHDVGADDVGVDVAGRRDADHLVEEGLVLGDQLDRDTAGADDFLAVIDVIEERVDGAHALLDAARQSRPFAPGNDPRHDVERDQPFGRFRLPVDIERDAGAPEEGLRLLRLPVEPKGVLVDEPAMIIAVGRTGLVLSNQHLIEDTFRLIHSLKTMFLRIIRKWASAWPTGKQQKRLHKLSASSPLARKVYAQRTDGPGE